MKREKELRLALVLYGGVSLAVYMFGVTREIQKLARASRLFFAEQDPKTRQTRPFPDQSGRDLETDTETIFYDLIQTIAIDCEIRIVCDVISGASAGGINGMFLARALAHDLPLDPLRSLWLNNADVMALADDEAKSARWAKSVLNPVLRRLMTRRLDFGGSDPETRDKLSSFMKLRWFAPPFSGQKFTGWMLDACDAMDARNAGTSLLPDGHPLDLFLSLTDFHGHPRRLKLHNPRFVDEREHRFPIGFRYRRGPLQGVDMFGADHVPGLVFAARATASFPGAFPPATIGEIDNALAARQRDWLGRDAFIRQHFSSPVMQDRNVETIPFIDGSVVNNKPFGAAIDALGRRPANREVIRRVVYIDPDPKAHGKSSERAETKPGFFRTIVSSLSEIPRNEPIFDDLAVISDHNRRVRLIASAIDAAVPQVAPMVERIIAPDADAAPSAETFARWRDKANTAAAAQSGFAFQSYLRLKTLLVLRRVSALVAGLSGDAPIDYAEDDIEALVRPTDPRYPTPDATIRFLRGFDLDFRVRRLRFVIYRLNGLYQSIGPMADGARLDGELLDELKDELYRQLDSARALWLPENHDPALCDAARALQQSGQIPDPDKAGKPLAEALRLAALDARSDELFSVMLFNYLPDWARHFLIVAYVGFPFFDVLTLPMTQKTDLEELDAILVDRISPADATLANAADAIQLKGAAMHHFGAFFNRRWRESDYLLGRLTAAERLVDIVIDAAGATSIDAAFYKRRLFTAILDAEAAHLTADPDLIVAMRARFNAPAG